MDIRLLSPRELPGLAQTWETAMGARFPTAEQLVARGRGPRLASAAVAGDEIVAAALADLTCKDGVRLARIWLLASFLGDKELDRRLKCALVLNLHAPLRRLQANHLEIRTDHDDHLVRMIFRRLKDRAIRVELPRSPDEAMPRSPFPRSSSGEGSSGGAFPRAKAGVTVTLIFT